jgi:hypothetical protein
MRTEYDGGELLQIVLEELDTEVVQPLTLAAILHKRLPW